MTHLHPFNFCNLLVANCMALLLFLTISKYVFNYNFFAVAMKGFRQWNIKFYCYALLVFMLVMWITYTIIGCYVVFTPVHPKWVKEFADVLFNFVLTSHSSCMFLIIAYLRIVASETLGSSVKFMSNFEFRVYVVYSIIAIPAYVILQYIVRGITDNHTYFVLVPQMIYTCEMTICSILFVWLIYRLRAKVKTVGPEFGSSAILKRIIVLLWILIAFNMTIGWSIGIINSVLLADGSVNRLSPFIQYTLTVFFNWGYFFMVNTVMLILNVGVENNLSIHSSSDGTGTKTSRTNRTSRGGAGGLNRSKQLSHKQSADDLFDGDGETCIDFHDASSDLALEKKNHQTSILNSVQEMVPASYEHDDQDESGVYIGH